MTECKIVVFTCNWSSYSGLETAGSSRITYPPAVRPVKVMCLGQLSAGTILKALAKGAAGVLLLACPPGECHFQFGNRHAEELFAEAQGLARLLGYRDEQLKMAWVAAGEGQQVADRISAFVTALSSEQRERGSAGQVSDQP